MIKCDAYEAARCSSCELIQLPYETGLKQKVEALKSLFQDQYISAAIESTRIKNYRNKAKFIVGGDLNYPVIGIPNPKDKLLISPLVDCQLHSKAINKVAEFILNNITEFNLTPYSIKSQTGEFKYLFISEGYKSQELSIRFGMRSLESKERVLKLLVLLQKEFPKLKVCTFEVQPKHAAIFKGEEYHLLSNKFIQHDYGKVELSSSSSNFFQVNSLVAQALYEFVYNRFEGEGIKNAVDLFCGVGGFAQQLSRFSSNVFAIEIDQVAIECARYSAKKNNISNIKFYCDDANNFRDHIATKLDLIVVNPPRRGLGERLTLILEGMKAEYIVYSSCNSKSLKQDLELLSNRYEIESMTPVDMFPLTKHLEVLCVLKKII